MTTSGDLADLSLCGLAIIWNGEGTNGFAMKYKLIEIKPSDRKWVVRLSSVEGDREETQTVPNAMGYYYFPEEMSEVSAFAELKSVMIESHEEEIKKLQDSLLSLKRL